MTSAASRPMSIVALLAMWLLMVFSPVVFSQGTKPVVKPPPPSTSPSQKSAKTSDLVNQQKMSSVTLMSEGMQDTDLTGQYDALVTFSPQQKARGTVTIAGDEFKFEAGDVTLKGAIADVSLGRLRTITVKYSAPDGRNEEVSLRLTQQGKTISLRTFRGSGVSFKVVLQCPDPPGCMESDLCRPFCK